MTRTIYYLPIEPYKERYTYQLAEWTRARFLMRGISLNTDTTFFPVTGLGIKEEGDPEGVIETGGPLDCHHRSYWALTQTATLVSHLRQRGIKPDDIFYFQDMFHPGLEAALYIAAQCGVTPGIYVINWAQSVDVYDFTFPMRAWMRHYEQMVASAASGMFVASTGLKQLCEVAVFPCPIYMTGLPFDSREVRNRVAEIKPWTERAKRVVFTSRLDKEKQPHFFFMLVAAAKKDPELRDYEFAICTGNPELRSNEKRVVQAARAMESEGKLRIYTGLEKDEYYRVLADSRAHFHCSLQDWVSYTLLEAAALGTPSLVPAFRAFPEAVRNNYEQMYLPWSLDHALLKLKQILSATGTELSEQACPQILERHDQALDRHIDVMLDFPISNAHIPGGH